MPDTLRTVGEDFEAFAIDYCRKQDWLGKDGLPLANADWAAAAHVWVEAHEDALIGAQGRVVYTEEDVERCEEAAGLAWVHGKSIQEMTRAVLTAAGGVVANKVVEVRDYCETDISVPSFDANGDPDYIRIYGGDTLYIVRAKEDSE